MYRQPVVSRHLLSFVLGRGLLLVAITGRSRSAQNAEEAAVYRLANLSEHPGTLVLTIVTENIDLFCGPWRQRMSST